MKKSLIITGIAAALAVIVLETGAFSESPSKIDRAEMSCPMMTAGVKIKVTNIARGVRIELTSSEASTVSAVRAQARRMAAMMDTASVTPSAPSRHAPASEPVPCH